MAPKTFCLSARALNSIIKGFHYEMSKGLAGRRGSLAMIRTFARMPSGKEKGRFIALDLGGTNFRMLEVVLNGDGKVSVSSEKKFRLKTADITGDEERLFGFIADSVKRFVRSNPIAPKEKKLLGFTFSFPVRQKNIAHGALLCWNKGFSAKNAVGKDIVGLLDRALKKKGLHNIKIAALINDTIGTLATRRYSDPDCDMGVILGTGTNACYPEARAGGMAINIEWGNFNKLPRTRCDRKLDSSTVNPGRQILEKMVSGMYLGELARLVLLDITGKKISGPWQFTTSHVSLAEGDNSGRLAKIDALLKGLGIKNSTYADRLAIKQVCGTISRRSAQISAAAIAAVILWMDPKVKKDHTVAVDGSLFEKWPGYRSHIKASLNAILKEKAGRIRLALTKDGSGKGAAVAAAVAATG